jgi:predicted metalloprotease with PDZ domain
MRVLTRAAVAFGLLTSTAAAQAPTIAYEITVDTARRNQYSVAMNVRGVGRTFQIAFAKHPVYDDKPWRAVRNLALVGGDDAGRVTRVDSAVWRIHAASDDVTITYSMATAPYAPPRPAYRPFLTPTGGLVGDLHSFAYVVGHTRTPARVKVNVPDGWRIVTQLQSTSDSTIFFAPNADALMDAPILVGHLREWRFVTDHAPYRIAYWAAPLAADFDPSTMVTGITKLTDVTAELFGGVPWPEYSFLLQDGAFGALEHSASASIGTPARDVALDTWEVLSNVAHEFFHAWNLVRIRPGEHRGIDYRGQPPVSSLWFGEGVTMFYADLLLRRAGIQTPEPMRTTHLQNLIATYARNPAYRRFTAEHISRVANSENPHPLGDYDASIHVLGELLGTMLDLVIRDATNDGRSMDDVMRALYRQFGAEGSRGVMNADIERTIETVCGCDVTPFFDAHVRGARPLELNRYLGLAGLNETTTWRPARSRDGTPAPDLRLSAWQPPGDSAIALLISDPASVWAKGGLHTGDRLIALNGTRIRTPIDARNNLARLSVGDTALVQIRRAGQTQQVRVRVTGYDEPIVRVTESPNATEKQRRIRERWFKAER